MIQKPIKKYHPTFVPCSSLAEKLNVNNNRKLIKSITIRNPTFTGLESMSSTKGINACIGYPKMINSKMDNPIVPKDFFFNAIFC